MSLTTKTAGRFCDSLPGHHASPQGGLVRFSLSSLLSGSIRAEVWTRCIHIRHANDVTHRTPLPVRLHVLISSRCLQVMGSLLALPRVLLACVWRARPWQTTTLFLS